jgi:hypothetical protein
MLTANMCATNRPFVFPAWRTDGMTVSIQILEEMGVGVWGGGSGIGGGTGDGAACHAYALHGPSQRRSMGASLQRLLV